MNQNYVNMPRGEKKDGQEIQLTVCGVLDVRVWTPNDGYDAQPACMMD